MPDQTAAVLDLDTPPPDAVQCHVQGPVGDDAAHLALYQRFRRLCLPVRKSRSAWGHVGAILYTTPRHSRGRDTTMTPMAMDSRALQRTPRHGTRTPVADF